MLVVPKANWPSTHYTPIYLHNIHGVLDVEGYVPKETILDTRATQVMLSKAYATAMHVYFRNLNPGTEFVTAGGAVEMLLGVCKNKVKFTLARGTPNMCTVEVYVTVVDTTAYDALLGMEFLSAVDVSYDTYTKMFKYRWTSPDGLLHNHEVSAPCHVSSPPLIAYACFGGLISGELELNDVQGADEDIIPCDENFGSHTSPLELVASKLQLLSKTCNQNESVRLRKEVREQNLARGENAVARLAAVTPLALPTLLPSSKWLGDASDGIMPINTSTRQLSMQSKHKSLYILELFC